jgi:hypothetical protein
LATRVGIPLHADLAPLDDTSELPAAYVEYAESIEPANGFLECDESFVSGDHEAGDEEDDDEG